ncbi:hypothetical protein [Nostoc commune]|nr:hypothetical protein [Nostoc commune]
MTNLTQSEIQLIFSHGLDNDRDRTQPPKTNPVLSGAATGCNLKVRGNGG